MLSLLNVLVGRERRRHRDQQGCRLNTTAMTDDQLRVLSFNCWYAQLPRFLLAFHTQVLFTGV